MAPTNTQEIFLHGYSTTVDPAIALQIANNALKNMTEWQTDESNPSPSPQESPPSPSESSSAPQSPSKASVPPRPVSETRPARINLSASPRTPKTPRPKPAPSKNRIRKNEWNEYVALGITPCPGEKGIHNGVEAERNPLASKYLLRRWQWEVMRSQQSEGERWLRWKLRRRGGEERKLVRRREELCFE